MWKKPLAYPSDISPEGVSSRDFSVLWVSLCPGELVMALCPGELAALCPGELAVLQVQDLIDVAETGLVMGDHEDGAPLQYGEHGLQ